MNKIQTINLGGNPFTVDDDAYEYLQAYIRSLKKHFKNSPGCDEIISDIEGRLAELLAERAEGKAIVTLREVKEVITIMGSPEEFGADPIDEKQFDPERPRKQKSGRRLFKDPDDKVISGVCSGIAAYFGINDPTWVRVAFAIGIIGGGISFWLYIILAIILPKADSAADRLAMKGEPIDYASIAKKVQEEIEHLSHEFGSPIDPETKKQFDASMATAGKAFSTGRGVLAGIFVFIGSILKQIIPFALKIASIVLIVMLSLMLVGLIFGWSMLWPYAQHFVAGPRALGALSMMNLFFLVMIPFAFVLMLGARFYNGTRMPKAIAAGLGGLWLLNLLGGVSFGVNTGRQFSNTANQDKTVFEGKISSDVLTVEYGEKKDREDIFTLFGAAWIEDEKMVFPRVPIHIVPSKDDQFHIIQENIASGASTSEAKRRANNISNVASFTGNTLKVNNFIEVDKFDKIRNQHASVFIHVPIGKQIKIAEHLDPVDGDRDADYNGPWDFAGKQWKMTEKGLVCDGCELKTNDLGNTIQESIGQALEQLEQNGIELGKNAEELAKNLEQQSKDLGKSAEELAKEIEINVKSPDPNQNEKIIIKLDESQSKADAKLDEVKKKIEEKKEEIKKKIDAKKEEIKEVRERKQQ